MNKQELIDKAVHALKGVLPSCDTGEFIEMHDYICRKAQDGSFYPQSVCSTPAFQQRASELGYINGYRWGVEYPTNGKKPDLPDDVVVCIEKSPMQYSVDCWDWSLIELFKITDQRYKPADTSYLDSASEAAESKSSAESVSESAELSIAIADAMNVAVESGEIEIAKRLQEINKDVLAEANKRKAEAEKRRVVEAAQKVCINFYSNDLSKLYDAGFLCMPAE